MTDKDNKTDLIWWDLGYFLKTDPYEPAMVRVREKTRLFRNFLIENGFVRPGKFPPVTAPVADDFIIRLSDLTEEGVAFVKDATDRWLRANDDLRKPISMRSLERSLKKLRGQGPPGSAPTRH